MSMSGDMSRADEIRENAVAVERRVVAACERAGRHREEVLLVAVTKTFPAADVSAAIAAGLLHVGENRVQEARDKQPAVTGSARWHLIGHLQSNKAKDAVRLFDVIHTVDSLDLGERIARHAEAAGKRQEVLIEVNLGQEPQKAGADPRDVARLAKELQALPALHLAGLMAIPPHGEPEETRPWFRQLKTMRDDLGLEQLSMGMTDDFDVAIEEGATIIRVGRAIFGSRG
ncbi:MAG TPA: YggS family pyridoxal phosphate-dependent enzyme [Thermoanaerobaculia bacterium]